jgi:two-component system LytT family sensor kinase
VIRISGVVAVVAIACLVGAVSVVAFVAGRRAASTRRIPFDAVSELVESLAGGLAGDESARAVRRAQVALGVPALDLVDAASVEVHRSSALAEIRVERAVVGALVAQGADRESLRHLHGLARLVQFAAGARELRAARELQTQAQLVALKTQIRPHFIYNALNVIGSLTISDPERARTLLVEFADFTRYWFRERGPFAALADELRAIEGYLLLERARYGERLSVRWEISPESLSTRIPHLCIQPLVENAVRHGIESEEGRGSITIAARDEGVLTVVTVEDDGVGMEPDRLADVLAGELAGVHVGLRNVDARLRQTYGDAFGLVVETALGAGTLITVRVPKFVPEAGRH